MITKRNGNGQTICKGCKDKGKFGLTWDFIKDLTGDGISKLKDWYEIWRYK